MLGVKKPGYDRDLQQLEAQARDSGSSSQAQAVRNKAYGNSTMPQDVPISPKPREGDCCRAASVGDFVPVKWIDNVRAGGAAVTIHVIKTGLESHLPQGWE